MLSWIDISEGGMKIIIYFLIPQSTPGCCANVIFIPSVEKIQDGAILPDFPEKLMESATPIPTIVGFTDQEGLLYYLG